MSEVTLYAGELNRTLARTRRSAAMMIGIPMLRYKHQIALAKAKAE
jgi:hypothetical protein